MSSSEATPLTIVSDLDVQISLYDGSEDQIERRYGELTAHVRAGIYRVETERAGRIASLVFEHDGPTELRPSAPPRRTPAPIAGAATSHEYYTDRAVDLSTSATADALGAAPHTGHLLVFVRREARDHGPRVVPSEPIAVLDVNGRPLAALSGDRIDHSDHDGYVAYAAKAAPGIYRIRATRSHRDIAVPILPGRAAHVFVADAGDVQLEDLRIFLPIVGEPFAPHSPIGPAMEAVLDALRSPSAGFPSSVRPLLSAGDLDPCMGVAAAHVMMRGATTSDAELDALIARLEPYTEHMPDAAILHQMWRWLRREPMTPCKVSAPPLLRASFLAAMTDLDPEAVRVPQYSAIAESARGGHHDSIWWTWSHRPWDGDWVMPTISGLLPRIRERNLLSIARTIARATGLPLATVAHATEHIATTVPTIGAAAISATLPDLEKPRIDGYSLGERLGCGSQGTVYRAIRDKDNEPVALKVIAFTGGRGQHRAAMREIRAMEPVDHPNLVRLAASGALPDESGMWLDLELCRGSVLDRLAELDAPMSVDVACRIMSEALAGLAHLHDRGIVHRDVKPENLLLRNDGSVAVADFGLARSAALRSTRPRPGGTARFAPPEQLVDVEQAVPASDVWSAAATLYFLLTLELPREEYADQSDLQAARENPVIPIRQRRAEIPPALAEAIDAALSMEVFRRPPDAHALRKHLLSALAPPPSWSLSADRPAYALVINDHTPSSASKHDAYEIGRMFVALGFKAVQNLDGASADEVRRGFDRLVTNASHGHSIALYYSGRECAYTGDPAQGDAALSIELTHDNTISVLTLPLGPLLAMTTNVTIITDACTMRSGAANLPDLPIVQLSATSANGTTYEYTDEHWTPRGAFTAAFIEVLYELGSQFSWNTILRAIRSRMSRRFPMQSPQLAGPAHRRPFSLSPGHEYEAGVGATYELYAVDNQYAIGGGDVAGLVAGDRLAAMPPASFTYDATAALGELEIVEVLPAVALARVVTGQSSLPDGAVAVPIGKSSARRPVAIDIHQRVSPRFFDAIAAAPILRIARSGDRAIATVRYRHDELVIDDDLGPLCGHGELGRQFGRVIHELSNLAAAQALRDLEGEYGIALDAVEIALAASVDDVLRPLPHHRAVLGLRDRLGVTIANRSHRMLYTHVFAIDPRGGISLLSGSDPTGIAIEPGAGPHVLRDIAPPWPTRLPEVTPRIVDIVAIVTTRPARLGRLVARNDEPTGSHASPDTAPQIVHPRGLFDGLLEDRFAQLRDGQAVDLRDGTSEFFVARLPLWVVPIHSELQPLRCEFEAQPLARSLARAVQAASEWRLGPWRPATANECEIAIQLVDLTLPPGFRLDAVITTQSPFGTPVLHTWRAGTASAPVFAGRMRGLLDIALFVSHDAGVDLAALLAPAALAAAIPALCDPEVTSVPLALGAGALITRQAYAALRSAAGDTSCVYHTTFLAADTIGTQRHPTSGVYHASAVSFALAISGASRAR